MFVPNAHRNPRNNASLRLKSRLAEKRYQFLRALQVVIADVNDLQQWVVRRQTVYFRQSVVRGKQLLQAPVVNNPI